MIHLFNRYLLSASLPSDLLRHREINENVIKLVLSSSSWSKSSETTEGGKRARNSTEGRIEVPREDEDQQGWGNAGQGKGGFQAEGLPYGPKIRRHGSSLRSENYG